MTLAPPLPRVVIVGCGFGGLEAVRRLSREPVEIVLVDRTNHHLFQPLLYQVATAGLSAPAVSASIRSILRREMRRGNLTVLQAEVTDLDAAAGTVRLDDGTPIAYDHLVVAAGATHSYFGHDDWARHAPGLKTLADAFEIRARVLGAFERAERCDGSGDERPWLNFVVIGGGPTGVELAGTLVEIARHTLVSEFRRIDPRHARIVLMEGGERLLTAFERGLSESAQAQLERLGVEVMTGCRVTAIDAEGVRFRRGDAAEERIDARTVLWAAGVGAVPLGRAIARATGVTLDRQGRVPVQPDLTVAGWPGIQVVGDLAAAACDGRPVPGVSPAAKQMGRHAAENIVRRLHRQPAQPFRYRDHGTLATIGRHSAVVQLERRRGGRLRLTGYPAWLFWLFAHVFFLIDFRSRVIVLFHWAWSYWTFDRHARAVAGPRMPGAPPQVPEPGPPA